MDRSKRLGHSPSPVWKSADICRSWAFFFACWDSRVSNSANENYLPLNSSELDHSEPFWSPNYPPLPSQPVPPCALTCPNPPPRPRTAAWMAADPDARRRSARRTLRNGTQDRLERLAAFMNTAQARGLVRCAAVDRGARQRREVRRGKGAKVPGVVLGPWFLNVRK